ncbi:MAG: hypothetical protein H6729_07700 [Deltaproteobacteria bacterium]|nr:hypothetical protein [Deltaproteobacteria bacterium]
MQTAGDLASAARRHIRDARTLLRRSAISGLAPSPDQAWHLAGFGPECARKAALPERDWDRILGHNLGPASDEIIGWLECLLPICARYTLRLGKDPKIPRWSPEHRYEHTGSRTEIQAEDLVEEAERITDNLLLDLWLDGRLEGLEG